MEIEIEVVDLHKLLKSNTALAGVSTTFDARVMHGVIGPEGAGKTTLFRHLIGLLSPTSGKILYRCNQIEVPLASLRERVAYMPQQQSLYADLSIDEHLEFFKELYALTSEQFKEKREQLLRMTRLESFVDRPAGQLSGGMYKKLGLMCALMSSPKVLLLDEPTNGVDPISRREFWDLLYRLQEEKILIIVATAYMDEADRCGKVHLIESGKLLAAGEPKTMLMERGLRSFDEFFLQHRSSA